MQALGVLPAFALVKQLQLSKFCGIIGKVLNRAYVENK